MAHAYTTKRGKNKKAKLGVRKDQQQNSERSLKAGPANLQQFLYDGPKESTIGVIGRIGCSSSASSQARLENVKTRLQKALMDKCSNPDCTNAQEGTTLSECSGCRSVRYCSRDCQLAHWSAHKELCKSIKKKLQEEELERQKKVMEALQELQLQENSVSVDDVGVDIGDNHADSSPTAIPQDDESDSDSSDEDVEDINDIN
jgi:hypothetical protein